MKVLELKSANAALGAATMPDGSKCPSVLAVTLPRPDVYANSPAQHTFVADEMYPMPASFEFPLTDARAITIPEGARFCGVYFKHFLSFGDSPVGQDPNLWHIRTLILGLVTDGTVFKPITVIPNARDIINNVYRKNVNNTTEVVAETFENETGYHTIMSNMVKLLLPPGISHVYPLFRYFASAQYSPLPGPLTFHVRFW